MEGSDAVPSVKWGKCVNTSNVGWSDWLTDETRFLIYAVVGQNDRLIVNLQQEKYTEEYMTEATSEIWWCQ